MPLTLDRRQTLAAGIATTLFPFGPSIDRTISPDQTLSLRPFAGSSTISKFAFQASFEVIPVPSMLRHAIDIESHRPVVRLDSLEDERGRAEFLAWFAIRCVAPHHLRRAGYDVEAADCVNQTDLWSGMLAAAGAQHRIGYDYRGGNMPALASIAYGAAAHAANAANTAGITFAHDLQAIAQTGSSCARAVTSSIYSEDDVSEYRADPTEVLRTWSTVVHVINAAMMISPAPPLPA